MLYNQRRVVVTGMGVISPIGLTVSDMWEGLISGKSGINYISYFDPAPFETKFAAEVKDLIPPHMLAGEKHTAWIGSLSSLPRQAFRQ